MGCESFDVVRLHLGPLLQDQIRVAKLKSAFSWLINEKCLLNYVSWPLSVDTSSRCVLSLVGPRGLMVNQHMGNYGLGAGNLFMWSDLTLGPSFKVKRGYSN